MLEDNQIPEEFKPAASMTITSIETLRVMSHPLRLQILETLLYGSRTVKQISEALGTTPTKLYYHMNMLEQHGLLRVVGTRVVSGIIEKQYAVTATNIQIDKSLYSAQDKEHGGTGFSRMISTVFERTTSDIMASLKAGLIDLDNTDPERVSLVALHSLSRMSPEQGREFTRRFQALISEFNKAQADNEVVEGSVVYGLTLALYPTTYSGPIPHEETNE